MTILGSLKRRLIAGTAMLVLLVLGTALIGVNAIRSLNQAVTQDLDTVLRADALSTSLLALASDQIRVAETYLVTPSRSLAVDFLSLGDFAHATHRSLRQIPGLSEGDQSRLNRIGENQSRIEVAYARAHALKDLGRDPDARAAADQARGPADTLTKDIRELTSAQKDRIDRRTEELRNLATRRQSLVWVLFLAALLLGIGTAAWIVQSIDVPLSRLVAATIRFGNGDLRPVDLGSMPEELASLGRAVNRMGGRLRTVVENVVTEAREVSATAGDFSAMSQELAASSTEIANEVSEVNRSALHQVEMVRAAEDLFHQIRDGVVRNARLAKEAAELGARIRSIAEYHRAGMSGAASALGELRTVMMTSKQEVKQLAAQAQSLVGFVDGVKDLSSRSGVLAVNASVEAARAGEDGQGFMAIAGEMRTLAETSGAAAESAAQAATLLDAAIEQTTTTLETGAARVLAVESSAKRTAGALDEIIQAVEAVAAAAEKVVDGVGRNHELVGSLAERTAELDRIARQNAAASDAVAAGTAQQTASTEEIASTATLLLEAAQRMQTLVADFRT